MLRSGSLADKEIEVNAQEKSIPTMQVFSNSGMEEMGMQIQDMMGQMMGGPKRTRLRRVKVEEAKEIFAEEEANKLIDQDQVVKEAIRLTEESGIVFLDEIDKIAKRGGGHGPDVSREGVQRDILPIVEGSTVTTKYGQVKTDHILFIAAGAFHRSRPSDMMPELQGRFPIRVELDDLTRDDFVRILTEPSSSLTRQYQALLAADGVKLKFTKDGIEAIADYAYQVNQSTQNIGARRLHTILERLLEEASFEAPEDGQGQLKIHGGYVRDALEEVTQDEDLSRFIL